MSSGRSQFRNIALIAHVDHGKTTLVDQLLREAGVWRENQQAVERAMDSMDLEREKGITIKAKNASIHWKDYTINIVDTPGHADFGGEVERIMKMVDGVLLVVDACDGPQAQTKFVLKKALANQLKPIVVINKVDRPQARPHEAVNAVFDLFLELHASEDQMDFPILYASAKEGFAKRALEEPSRDMTPLLEAIVEHIPPPAADLNAPFRMLVSNLDWNDYVGRVGIGKISGGRVRVGDSVVRVRKDGKRERAKVTKIWEFSGLGRSENIEGIAGNIIGISGFEDLSIGETITDTEERAPLPFVEIDPPTLQMQFAVNDSPLAGRDGKFLTARHLRERLYKEIRTNISLQVNDTDAPNIFDVSARGVMQIAVLIETMRREGFEVLVSRPEVILRKDGGKVLEPIETLFCELPAEKLGDFLKNLAARKAAITDLRHLENSVSIEADIPTRGLIGLETDLMNLTNGRGLMSHLFKQYGDFRGEILMRQTGALVAKEAGVATAYALSYLQKRGRMFIKPGDEIYEGMVVGENPRAEDLVVNPCKTKHLTNMRSKGEGEAVKLEPPMVLSLERALEYIAADEYVEATPKLIRLRKKILSATARKRAGYSMAEAEA
jgi:GTP-binding protein